MRSGESAQGVCRHPPLCRSVGSGETAAQAMRRAVGPVAVKHGLNDEYLDFFGDPEKSGYADLWFDEQEFDGYVLYLVLAAHGGLRLE